MIIKKNIIMQMVQQLEQCVVVKDGYNMLFRDFFLETASEGLFIAKTASEGNFMPKIVPQTSIYREIFPQKILT